MLTYVCLTSFALVITLVMFGACIHRTIKMGRHKYLIEIIFAHILLLATNLIACAMRYNGVVTEFYKVLWIMRFELSYIVIGLFHCYLVEFIALKTNFSQKWILIMVPVFVVSSILWICSMQNGLAYTLYNDGSYVMGDYNFLYKIPGLFIILTDIVIAIYYHKQIGISNAVTWSCYGLFPILAYIFGYGFDDMPFYLSITVDIILIYITFNFDMESDLIYTKYKLAKSTQKVMVSQIRPHFINNVLVSIAQLCDDNPKEAKETTIAFAEYLRSNIKALETSDDLISFEEELKHIKTYLYIEKVRFGDDLNVEYDIKVKNFYVPILSLQPIVENAVKHGVGMSEDGGTVKISTQIKDKDVVITIRDDGVGFTLDELQAKDNRVGMKNTKERLSSMCGAKLEVNSIIGEGTVVIIRIPIRSDDDEHIIGRR